MLLWLYRILFFPFFIVMLPFYLKRMVKRGGYGAFWWHRIGLVPVNISGKKTLWIQAVSVGEIEALEPLIQQLKDRYAIYLTTTTSTAFKVAHKRYEGKVAYIAYFPLDFCLFNKLAWRRIRPCAALLMESELWPEHLHSAKKYAVPLYLINARCSDRSYRRYQHVQKLANYLLSHFTKAFASSALDAQRYQALCPNLLCEVSGNLKVDAALARVVHQDVRISRQDVGEGWENATILLGASTWPAEEDFLIKTYLELKKLRDNLRLILVPRHVERTAEIEKILSAYELPYGLRSKGSSDASIYLVNTTGELGQFVRFSDFVFIGKSLFNNRGGQTPIEAAAYGKSMLYGPNMQNFKAICLGLESAGAAYCGANEEAIVSQLKQWIMDPDLAKSYGDAAARWIKMQQGATEKTVQGMGL